jgi:hypothetical protein
MIGFGCAAMIIFGLFVCALSLVLLIPILPRLGLQMAGLEPAGDTSSVFAIFTPIPTIQVQNPVAPAQVVVDAGQYGTFNIDARSYDVAVGESTVGTPLATATFNESQLLDLCRQRTLICGIGDSRVRKASIDLRPGGAVINAEFYIPQFSLWQQAGIVLKLNSATVQFDVMGVDFNGTLYNVPPGEISESVNRVADTGNDLLRSVAIIAEGEVFQLSEIYADDTQLTLVLK